MLCLNFLVPKCYLVSFWLLCLAWIISLLVDFSSFSYYVFTLVDFSSFSYYVFTLWCLWAFQTLLCLSIGPVPFFCCAPIVWLWVIYWHPLYFHSWLCLDYALVVLIPSFITSVTNEQ
jgi:hypothetical protein